MAPHDSSGFNNPNPAPPIEVPPEALTPEILDAVVENFILREGTDYGSTEFTYETKANQIRKQLQRDEIKIVFDPESETVSLVTARDWNRRPVAD